MPGQNRNTISHGFADYLRLEMQEALDEWVPFAVLDTPFAEALQSCFVGFYSAVGLPMLDPGRFGDIDPLEGETVT